MGGGGTVKGGTQQGHRVFRVMHLGLHLALALLLWFPLFLVYHEANTLFLQAPVAILTHMSPETMEPVAVC